LNFVVCQFNRLRGKFLTAKEAELADNKIQTADRHRKIELECELLR
jgi:hypothetical protein